jgi:hypothetical protein
MGTLSDYLQLIVKLKEKIYLNLYKPKMSKQNTTFVIHDFFHLPLVSMTTVVHLELRIFPEIFKKLETALMGYSEAWRKLIIENNRKQKSRATVPILYNLQNI